MATPPAIPGPVNLGTPEEFTIRQLAEEVIRLTGSRSRIVAAPLPADDPKQRCPDIGLARDVLDWEPRVSLRDGLPETIEYFSTMLQARNG
jgi:UDP-glucuronate decarboxylase